MPNFDLFCIGDCAIDQYMTVASGQFFATDSSKFCFIHGSKIYVDEFSTSVAGNVCNVGVGAKMLGLSVGIYTELGDDANGRRVLQELKELGIDMSSSKITSGKNTNVHSVILSGGERTILSYHEEREYGLGVWPKTKWIFYSSLAKGFETFQKSVVEYIKKNDGVGLVFNPGAVQLLDGAEKIKDVLEITDVLFVNEEEAKKILSVSMSKNEDLINGLHKLGPKIVVITLGGDGACGSDGESLVKIPVYNDPRPIVDRTGAGDAFSAGFLAGLFYKKSLKECMKWGAVNAASQIRVAGSIQGLCNKEDLERLSKEFN